MYSIGNILRQEPTTVSAAVIAILNVLAAAHVFAVSTEQLAAINTAVVMLLGLFYVRPLTASKAGLEKLATKKTIKKK